MTRTNLNRCSKLLVGLLVLAALGAPAAAVSVDRTNVPSEAAVGTQTSATVTLDALYQDPQLESWELRGSTELTDVSWTVFYYDQTGSKVDQESFTGQSFEGAMVNTDDDDVSEVRVKVTGTVPEVETYSYDPAQEFVVLSLTQTQAGGASSEIDTWTAHHFTEKSADARAALDGARSAIDAASASNTDEAETTFSQAERAFEKENFELATELANQAESQANAAKQSSQTRRTLLYAGASVLALGVVVGGVFWWRSQQDSYDKLG